MKFADRVQESTNTTGTGTITLAGAASNFRTFGSAFSNGDVVPYAILDNTNQEWEAGYGTIGAGTLARTLVTASSNSGSLINLQPGPKSVFCSITADLLQNIEPPGVIKEYAGDTLPDGYLWPAGQAVSRTMYSRLFDKIGTKHGAGNGTTTFNLPDKRGRVGVGRDDMNGTAANRVTTTGSNVDGKTLGATGGEESHTLTVAEMPTHTHIQNAHSHSILIRGNSGNSILSVSSSGVLGTPSQITPISSDTATNQNTGGGTPHPIMQPTLIMNYIIKT